MIWLLTLAAFLLRAGIGLWRPGEFAEGGYTLYIDIARSFLDGHGLCVAPEEGCAIRGPVYPLFLAPFVAASAWHAVVIAQAAIGAAVTPLTFQIGRSLFDRRVALIAAAAAAFNPYTAIHDTALQDTVIFNVLAIAAFALMVESSARSNRRWFAAGALLALATLTSFRMAIFIPFAFGWVVVLPSPARRRRVAAFSLPVLILLGVWSTRNSQVVGTPAWSTDTGRQLWEANHESIGEFLPSRSIDAAGAAFLARLDLSKLRAIEGTPSEADRDRIFFRMFRDRLQREPIAVAAMAVLKVVYAFDGYLSPARSGPVQFGFALIFTPISVLSAIGVWRCRRQSPGHTLVALAFLSFVVTTAIFWAHTSHVSYLHGLQFVYAAACASWIKTRPASAGEAYQSPAS